LALDYLHKRSIAHCDVTPSNLLICAPEDTLPGFVKLIDFGLSRAIENNIDCPRIYGVVTVWCRASELPLGDTFYTEKIDVWSARCIFAELLTGKVLFKHAAKGRESNLSDFNPQQISHVVEIPGPIPPDAIPPSYEHAAKYSETKFQKSGIGIRARVPDATPSEPQLLEAMLEYNPKRRISSNDALRHSYFNEQPIPVMNIAAQIPDTERRDLVNLGKSGPEV
jgi:cyclin-dependent kinase 8/11